MTDEELIAEARKVGAEVRARAGLRAIAGGRDRYAGWLLKELADRLEGRADAGGVRRQRREHGGQ